MEARLSILCLKTTNIFPRQCEIFKDVHAYVLLGIFQPEILLVIGTKRSSETDQTNWSVFVMFLLPISIQEKKTHKFFVELCDFFLE